MHGGGWLTLRGCVCRKPEGHQGDERKVEKEADKFKDKKISGIIWKESQGTRGRVSMGREKGLRKFIHFIISYLLFGHPI